MANLDSKKKMLLALALMSAMGGKSINDTITEIKEKAKQGKPDEVPAPEEKETIEGLIKKATGVDVDATHEKISSFVGKLEDSDSTEQDIVNTKFLSEFLKTELTPDESAAIIIDFIMHA